MLLVTVGSTHFTPLIQAVLSDEVLDELDEQNIDKLVVQYGKSVLPPQYASQGTIQRGSLVVQLIQYTDDFDALVRSSTAMISHAGVYRVASPRCLSQPGAGSILSALRAGKKLLVVPNLSLMDNHQVELASALEQEGHLAVATVE